MAEALQERFALEEREISQKESVHRFQILITLQRVPVGLLFARKRQKLLSMLTA